MASTPEGRTKIRVKKLLDGKGAYWFMPISGGFGAPSLDFLICHKGRFAAVETKAWLSQKAMTPRQILTTHRMELAKAKVFLIRDDTGIAELAAWLNSIDEEVKNGQD